MNLNLPGVIMFVVGVVLMYGAVKNQDPRDVVLQSLGQKSRFGPITSTSKIEPNPNKTPATPMPTVPAVPPGTIWTSV